MHFFKKDSSGAMQFFLKVSSGAIAIVLEDSSGANAIFLEDSGRAIMHFHKKTLVEQYNFLKIANIS